MHLIRRLAFIRVKFQLLFSLLASHTRRTDNCLADALSHSDALHFRSHYLQAPPNQIPIPQELLTSGVLSFVPTASRSQSTWIYEYYWCHYSKSDLALILSSVIRSGAVSSLACTGQLIATWKLYRFASVWKAWYDRLKLLLLTCLFSCPLIF